MNALKSFFMAILAGLIIIGIGLALIGAASYFDKTTIQNFTAFGAGVLCFGYLWFHIYEALTDSQF